MRVLVQTSGGLDSAAALIWALDSGYDVVPVFYEYGQVYEERERVAAKRFVRGIQLGHYAPHLSGALRHLEVVKLPLSTKATPGSVAEYVPLRNLALTAHSISMAMAMQCSAVVVGSKSKEHRPGDPYSFRDSCAVFFDALASAAALGTESTDRPITIEMPLMGKDKTWVVDFLHSHGYPSDELWTCYGAGPTPCGVCYHCQEYKVALAGARPRDLGMVSP